MNFMILKIWIKEKILNELNKYGYILSEDIHIKTLEFFLIKEIIISNFKKIKNKKWIKYKKNCIIKKWI